MKIICKVCVIILLCVCSLSGFTQTDKFEKAEVENSIMFKGNINDVWDYLSDLGNLQHLVPSTIEQSVVEGIGVGSTVTLTLKNKGKIVEKVTKLNPKKHRISYNMIETPLPIRDYLATFSIRKIDSEQIEVTFNANFEVQEINRKQRIDAFNNLQVELLENLKKLKGDE